MISRFIFYEIGGPWSDYKPEVEDRLFNGKYDVELGYGGEYKIQLDKASGLIPNLVPEILKLKNTKFNWKDSGKQGY